MYIRRFLLAQETRSRIGRRETEQSGVILMYVSTLNKFAHPQATARWPKLGPGYGGKCPNVGRTLWRLRMVGFRYQGFSYKP